MIHHFTRATRHLLFYSLLFLAIGLSSVRLVSSGIDRYKLNFAQRIGEQIGASVSVGQLSATVRGFSPELILHNISLSPLSPSPTNAPVITLKELRLGIHLLNLLTKKNWLESSWVTLVGAKLTLKRQLDGRIVIVGLTPRDDSPPAWLLQGRKYLLLQSDIHWLDEQFPKKSALIGTVDLAVINDGDRHRINALIKNSTTKDADNLRISVDFTGDAFTPDTVNGRAFVEGKNIKPTLWTRLLWPDGNAKSDIQFDHVGNMNFKLWTDLQKSKPVAITGDVLIQQVQLIQQNRGAFAINSLQTNFAWQQQEGQWQLNVQRFLLETVGKKWANAPFSIIATNDIKRIAIATPRVEVAELSTLAQFFVPLSSQQAHWLAMARPRGLLENFSLSIEPAAKQGRINAEFKNINVVAVDKELGVENLSGTINGNQQHGKLQLSTDKAQITFPDLFRSPLAINKLHGALAWRQTADAWILASRHIALDTPDMQTQTRLRVHIPKNDRPVYMDLQTAFAGGDMHKAPTYFPVGIMGNDVVTWLDNAFVHGQIKNVGVLIQGNLEDFPFDKKAGTFEAQFAVEQLELAYHPEWPHLQELNGNVLFLRDDLIINIKQGHSEQVSIQQAKVTIPTLSKSEKLLVQGELNGSIVDGLQFLQHTPLKPQINAVLNAITPQGQTHVMLDLAIPLSANTVAKVDGTVQLNNARLQINALDLPVTHITGDLKFNEQGIYAKQLTDSALGYPLQTNIDTDDRQTTVTFSGHTDIDTLQNQFNLPLAAFAEGDSDYQLKLALPNNNESPKLTVQSALQGITLKLPSSLAKSQTQEKPLSLRFDLTEQNVLPLTLNYDGQLKAAMLVNSKNGTVQSGHIVIGTGEPELPSIDKKHRTSKESRPAGISIDINQARLALQDWAAVATDQQQVTTSNIHAIRIQSKHGLWKNTDLGFFNLTLTPQNNAWLGTLNSNVAKGVLKIPNNTKGNDAIELTMDSIDLSAVKQLKSPATASQNRQVSPDNLPLIKLSSQKNLWQGIDLGQLNFSSERIANGMAIQTMELISETEKLRVTGNWRVNGQHSVTTLQGRLESIKAGSLLSKLAISKDLTDTSALVDFRVNWQDAPQHVSLAKLQGELELELKQGRILSIEPGFGRILGVLALAQWTKRIQLDFSDIYADGLTFDNIHGHFTINDGKATTTNLIVDAIPATITITGETNFVNRSFHQLVDVVPKSAEAIPIAGTIMSKIATVVTRTLTGKNHDGFLFGSQYQIRGTWKNPQIIPVHENDGLVQKIGNILTTFPWINRQ